MSLIAMAVYDTEENQRTEYTRRTLNSLSNTVDWSKHRLIVISNNSCKKTLDLLAWFNGIPGESYQVLKLNENLGTAAAINLAWKRRLPGENCVKMDNDVEFYSQHWTDELEEVIKRDSSIGQVGLKRKDCWETPWNEDAHYRSELKMLDHKPGEPWIIVEDVNHVMGTCVMHSSALLDKIGYLYQPKLYGFDDALMSFRSKKAGFRNVFLSHINIDHIDTGETSYQKWKEQHAGECWSEYHRMINGYNDGSIPLYYNPFN